MSRVFGVSIPSLMCGISILTLAMLSNSSSSLAGPPEASEKAVDEDLVDISLSEFPNEDDTDGFEMMSAASKSPTPGFVSLTRESSPATMKWGDEFTHLDPGHPDHPDPRPGDGKWLVSDPLQRLDEERFTVARTQILEELKELVRTEAEDPKPAPVQVTQAEQLPPPETMSLETALAQELTENQCFDSPGSSPNSPPSPSKDMKPCSETWSEIALKTWCEMPRHYRYGTMLALTAAAVKVGSMTLCAMKGDTLSVRLKDTLSQQSSNVPQVD